MRISRKSAHVGSAALFCLITDWITDCESEYVSKFPAFPIFLTVSREKTKVKNNNKL